MLSIPLTAPLAG